MSSGSACSLRLGARSATPSKLPERRIAGRAAAALAVLGSLVAAPATAGAAELTVYSSLPLDTPERAIYEDIVRGEQLALEQANGQAGGHNLRLVSLNDASNRHGQWDPELTARNARRAAQDPSTIAYLGEFNSGATAVSLPILNAAGVLQVSPTNSYAGLTRQEGADAGEPEKYYPTGTRTYGRVSPADHLQAAALAELLERKNVDRAFLVDDTEVYGSQLRRMLARRLRRRGITVAGHGVIRYRRVGAKLLTRIARSRAGAMVFTGITANGAVPLWRKVHRRFPRLKLIGSDGIADPLFTPRLIRGGSRAARRLGRSAAKRTWITLYTRPPDAWPAKGQAFAQDFRARYDRAPGEYAIFGYEAMQVVLDCVASAPGDHELRQRVVQAFFGIRDRDSVLGRYSIDENGDSTLSTYGVWRVALDGRGLLYDRTIDSSSIGGL